MRLSYIICACVLGKVVLLASLADGSEAQNTTTVKPTPSAIVGGYYAPKGTFPFIVALEVHVGYNRWSHVCGGALISSVWVLSARHCISAKNIQVMRVRGGMRCKNEVGYSSAVSYAKFYGNTDFAILRLSKALYIGGPYLRTIPIGRALSGAPYCYIMGWGVTSPKGSSSQCLKYSKINILNQNTCPNVFKNAWSLCVRYTTASACYGDSGGPLACYSDGKYYLVGLAWYVTQPFCGLNTLNSYTRVSYFWNFIYNTVG